MSREFSRPTQSAMQHLNGNIICAVDVETTGFKVGYHDIWQIAVLPLDADMVPNKSLMPFYMDMALRFPDHVDPKAVKLTKVDFARRMQRAHNCWDVADLFDEWFQRLELPTYKKICPLAQNWPFDKSFIKEWLGDETFEQLFSPHYRDTMTAALFENDVAGFRHEKVPYSKVNLAYLGSTLKVKNEKHHDALQDCITTAEIYRRQLLNRI